MTDLIRIFTERGDLAHLWDKNEFPQAAFAMGTLRALERGDRKPT